MIEPVAKSAISGYPLYQCEHCKAFKHSSQLRVLYGEPICLYCWAKFDEEAKWYGLDKISDAVEKPQTTCEACGCELKSHEARDIGGKPYCSKCWREKVKEWYRAMGDPRGDRL